MCVIEVVLGRDLADVYPLVFWIHILYNQAPFVRPLAEVHTQPYIRSEREKTNRQWMCLTKSPPGNLDDISKFF